MTYFSSKNVLLIFGGMLIFFTSPVFSKAETSNRGLIISPFLLERKMEKGQTTDELIEITNTSDFALPVEITVNDFFPEGDEGRPVFVEGRSVNPSFSLSSWITIKSSPKPTLKPGEKTNVSFSITPPHSAEEGGHYGAILFTFQGSRPDGSAVAIAQKLGAIILVKLGQAVQAGNISKFQTQNNFYEYPPVTFFTKFNNTGNVHVKPRGGINIFNWFGKRVASIRVNENAGNVLPKSERQFESIWQDKFAFGRYSAVAELVYDDSGLVVTAKTNFWVLPWKFSLKIGFGLFILIFLLVWGVKLYNRWLIRKIMNLKNNKK
jgi:hypothetical protein